MFLSWLFKERILCMSFLTWSALEAVISGSFLEISSTTASTSVLQELKTKIKHVKLLSFEANVFHQHDSSTVALFLKVYMR